jgi:hypothetical protein
MTLLASSNTVKKLVWRGGLMQQKRQWTTIVAVEEVWKIESMSKRNDDTTTDISWTKKKEKRVFEYNNYYIPKDLGTGRGMVTRQVT